LQQPNTGQQFPKTERATIGFALSLIAGILVLVQGIVRVARGELNILGVLDEFRRRILGGLALEVVGAIAIVFGVLILVGAILLYNAGNETAGGIIVLVFSALSILTGGGYVVGLVLGIIGGALGLAKK
jgi:hypothetical protein